MFKLVLEKAEEPEIKLPTSVGSQKKQKNSREKHLLLLHWLHWSLWLYGSQQTLGNSSRDGNTRPSDLSPENLYAGQEATGRTGHGTTDWFQIGKAVHQGCILLPCLLNFYAESIMWHAGLDEAQTRIKTAGRKINNLRYADDTTFMAESKEELKSLLMKGKEGSEKAGLKLNIQKTKIMASSPITSWQTDGETIETVTDVISLGSKITVDGDCSHEIKRRLLLGRKAMTNLRLVAQSCPILCNPMGPPGPSVHRDSPGKNTGVGCHAILQDDKPRQHIKKQRHYFADKCPSSQSYGFSSSHAWMWELDYKESWAPKNWCFWTVVLEKTLESPLDCKEIQPVHPKGNQPWIFIGRTGAEAETPILWPPDAKNWLIGKDTDAGKDWRQEEKGMTENDMVG